MTTQEKVLGPPRIAYIVSRFPALTETFVLQEMLEMEKQGVGVELYPLLRQCTRVIHPAAQPWIHRAHYHPFFSLAILRAHLYFIRRDPGLYLRVWAEVLAGTWGSPNFFVGAVAIFPKTVLFARQMLGQRVVHVHAQFANHPAVAALIIHRLTSIPFSFTARGTDIQVDQRMLKQKIEAAEFAIAVCFHNKQVMVKECGPALAGKIHVIHGGVDVDRLSATAKAQLEPRPFRILCVARFEEVKGHTYLIAACRLLQERGVLFECRLIGEGPLYSQVEKQIREAGLESRIHLLGPRTYEEVIHELCQSDVVVLPTAPTSSGKREGIPNVLKEAMACGLPVVASAVGGIPELVEDGRSGILLPPRDAVVLADALQNLSADAALRQRLGREGCQKVRREFNLKISTLKRAELLLGTGFDASIRGQLILAHQPALKSAAHHPV